MAGARRRFAASSGKLPNGMSRVAWEIAWWRARGDFDESGDANDPLR